MIQWRCYQGMNFAGYQNALPELTELEVIAKFEKRTGLMADSAVHDD